MIKSVACSNGYDFSLTLLMFSEKVRSSILRATTLLLSCLLHIFFFSSCVISANKWMICVVEIVDILGGGKSRIE